MSHSSAWFPCYVNDLLGSLRWRMMTPAERGAYWQLICWQMQADDGHLPADVAALSTLAEYRVDSSPAVLDAFPIDGTGRRANPRALAEWTRRAVISGTRSRAAHAKWMHMQSTCNAHADANAMHVQSTCSAYAPTSTSTSTEEQPQPQPEQEKRARKRAAATSFDELPEWLRTLPGMTAGLWDSWMATRRQKRAANTAHAVGLLVKKLEARQADAVAAVEMAVEAGWTGFEWEWFDRRRGAQPAEHRWPDRPSLGTGGL